jgi:hypothetical protein
MNFISDYLIKKKFQLAENSFNSWTAKNCFWWKEWLPNSKGPFFESDRLAKHFKWIWENDNMVPNFNENTFQTTLNSLRKLSTFRIDYINQEEKLRKASIELNKNKT